VLVATDFTEAGDRAVVQAFGVVAVDRSGRLERHVLEGAPADQLLALADRIGADLIVLGARSHSAVTRVLLGSVAQAVSERAKVPVLLVPVTPA
jgi:nucleotide-binding universal stress UspA family protein